MTTILPDCRHRFPVDGTALVICDSTKLIGANRPFDPFKICTRCPYMDHEPEPIKQPPPPPDPPCVYLGKRVRKSDGSVQTAECSVCCEGKIVEVDVFTCRHPKHAPVTTLPECRRCALKVPRQRTDGALKTAAEDALRSQAQAQPSKVEDGSWAYGVTTVPERRSSGLLLRTLASLRAAGFDRPRLFVDGIGGDEARRWEDELGLEVTGRQPRVKTVGNWLLAAWELLARHPRAGRIAVFQDDLAAVRNLRAYLDACPWPEKAYLNLYTFRRNEESIAGKPPGWHRGCSLNHDPRWQKGLGAVALAFTREALGVCLSSPHWHRKLGDEANGWQRADGAIVTAMNLAGWAEHVHQPSLVQHLGLDSSMGHHNQKQALSWRGEEFDALSLLGK